MQHDCVVWVGVFSETGGRVIAYTMGEKKEKEQKCYEGVAPLSLVICNDKHLLHDRAHVFYLWGFSFCHFKQITDNAYKFRRNFNWIL